MKSAYRLSGLEQKRLASVVFIKLVWFAWAIIPSPASQFWYQRKERDVLCPITGLNFQISYVSRPHSKKITMALSTGVIVNNCRQARHVVRMLAADWTRAHALAQRPFLKGQTSAGFSNARWGLSRSHVQ